MHQKESSIKDIFSIFSYTMLLGISSIFGFMNMVEEMGLAILAGSIGLAFANIDKISKFKGAGFEAEMCKTVLHKPTGIVHKLAEDGKTTSCGVDLQTNPKEWAASTEKVTCTHNGCKNDA